MEYLAVDIGPEFFEDQGHHIQTDIRSPSLPGLGPGSFRFGVVKIGDSAAAPAPTISE
jgi:hypothetical protein